MSCLIMTTLAALVGLIGGVACIFGWLMLWFNIADGKTWGFVVAISPVFIGTAVGLAMILCRAAQ